MREIGGRRERNRDGVRETKTKRRRKRRERQTESEIQTDRQRRRERRRGGGRVTNLERRVRELQPRDRTASDHHFQANASAGAYEPITAILSV